MIEILNVFVRGCPYSQPRAQPIMIGGHASACFPIKYRMDHPTKPGKLMEWYLWKQKVKATVRSQYPRRAPIKGVAIRVDEDFYFPRPDYMLSSKYPAGQIPHFMKPDRDNLDKLILDALGKVWPVGNPQNDDWEGIWGDDCQVCSGEPLKYWVARGDSPGARIVVSLLEDPAPELFDIGTWTCECGQVVPVDIRCCPKCGVRLPSAEVPVRPVRPAGRPAAAAGVPESSATPGV